MASRTSRSRGNSSCSEHTVKIHLQHIYQKLGVHRRLDLLKAKA